MAFQRLQIPVPTDLTYSPPGSTPQRSPLTLESGALPPTVVQWCDPTLAMRWFRYAQTLLSQLPSATAPIIPPGQEATALPRYRREVDAVGAIFQAIANGYNALNIPWYLHQSARALYWKYFCGTVDASSQSRLYYKENDAFPGWWTGTRPYPVLNNQTAGILPRRARDAALAVRVQSQYFIPTAGISLSVPDNWWNSLPTESKQRIADDSKLFNSIDYLPETQNRAFLIPGEYSDTRQTPAGADSVVDRWCLETTLSGGIPVPTPPYAFPVKCSWGTALGERRYPRTAFVNGQPSTPYDWRAVRIDTGYRINDTIAMDTMLGAYFYVPWLSEWVRLLNSSSPQAVILEAKQFAAYWNNEVLILNRNIQQALASPNQALGGNADLRVAASLSATLGAALAGVTYGISAVVGGALSAAFSIAAASPDIGLVRDTGRDDLGRWKPSLERAYLGGNPAYEDLTNGPPVVIVPDPVGSNAMSAFQGTSYDRLRNRVGQPSLAPIRAASPNGVVQPPEFQPTVSGSPGLSTGAKVAIGVTVVGILGYAAWQMSKGSK